MSVSSPIHSVAPRRHPRRMPRAFLWSALLFVPVLAIVLFATLQPIKVRPRMGLAPGYILTDQNGQQVLSEDLRGKLVLYTFTYAHCGQGCPQTTPTMRAVEAAAPSWKSAGLPLELVTISIDPARDTPEVLKQYAQAAGADAGRWRFLTGDAERIKNVVGGGFGSYYQANADGTITFEPAFVLVDGNGIVRAEYKTAAPAVAEIQRDVELIAEEVQRSSGAGRWVYEAAHLFMCYPKS